LRNCSWVIGIVTYTGHDTKIMLNSVKARPKASKMMKMMDMQIILLFIVLVILCLCCGLYSAIWYSVYKDDIPYLMID